MLEEMIPTEPNPPYDWVATLVNFLFLGLAGALGAVVRHIHTPARKWAQRISEWLGGALCSIYGSELIASAIHHILDKFDLIDSTYVVPEKLLGFAGFLCGALGVTVIDLTIKAIRKRFDTK